MSASKAFGRRPGLRAALVLLFLLGCSARASAHRLDEYLQATRVSVGRERVSLELDLTAGATVAPQVFALIDGDRDGQISAAEGASYARRVLASLVLEVDAHPLPIVLVDSQFPEYREMSLGVGMTRLRAVARIGAQSPGGHQLFYLNDHVSGMSVYLVNALVPVDDQIQIAGPRRDTAQHTLTLDYRVGPPLGALVLPGAFVAAFGLSCLALVGLFSLSEIRRAFTATGGQTPVRPRSHRLQRVVNFKAKLQ